MDLIKKILWQTDKELLLNQKNNKKAIANHNKTIELIDIIGGLSGNVLDIGKRNLLTEKLENKFNISIDSTNGDLDIKFECPNKKYNFIHYNNVIEHQFNPLFTLLEIKKRLKKNGILILGTPIKPRWITDAKRHFNEFNKYKFDLLILRGGFKIVKQIMHWKQLGWTGIRPLLGSFYKRQGIFILKKI